METKESLAVERAKIKLKNFSSKTALKPFGWGAVFALLILLYTSA
jgi:hypothetical protein